DLVDDPDPLRGQPARVVAYPLLGEDRIRGPVLLQRRDQQVVGLLVTGCPQRGRIGEAPLRAQCQQPLTGALRQPAGQRGISRRSGHAPCPPSGLGPPRLTAGPGVPGLPSRPPPPASPAPRPAVVEVLGG